MDFSMDFSAALEQLHGQFFDASRLPVAVFALLAVSLGGVLSGPLGGNAAPLFWNGLNALCGRVGGRLDNPSRTVGDLVSRGMFFALAVIAAAFLAGSGLQFAAVRYPNWMVLDVAALISLMSAGAGWHALIRLYRALNGKNLVKGAFYTLVTTTRTDLSAADEYTITRTGIAMGARLFEKGAVAPILWYLIGGLPAAFLYASLAALSWRYGRDGFTKGFGAAALALEKLMGFVPNAFAGMLISLAGLLTPTAGMTRSFIGLLHFGKTGKAGRAGYHEGGAPVTAMAYALNVSLGGPALDRDGNAVRRGWAGPENATARLEAGHLRRAVYIVVMAHLLFLTALLVCIVLDGNALLSPARP